MTIRHTAWNAAASPAQYSAGPHVTRADLERLSEWRRPDGSHPALGRLPIEEAELSPPDAFDDMEPDNEEFHEATAANYGVGH